MVAVVVFVVVVVVIVVVFVFIVLLAVVVFVDCLRVSLGFSCCLTRRAQKNDSTTACTINTSYQLSQICAQFWLEQSSERVPLGVATRAP